MAYSEVYSVSWRLQKHEKNRWYNKIVKRCWVIHMRVINNDLRNKFSIIHIYFYVFCRLRHSCTGSNWTKISLWKAMEIVYYLKSILCDYCEIEIANNWSDSSLLHYSHKNKNSHKNPNWNLQEFQTFWTVDVLLRFS